MRKSSKTLKKHISGGVAVLRVEKARTNCGGVGRISPVMKKEKKKQPLDINLDELLCEIDEGPPPELVIVPRRTNEHQQSSNPKQMTDQDLSQAIIRVSNQINSIAPKLPDRGVRFKANLKLMEDDRNRRNSILVQKQEHPKAKRFRTNGCPEVDTVACGTLRASHRHDCSSTDENDVDVEVPQSTSPSTSQGSEEIEINESLKVLAEASKARVEERKRKLEDEQKYSIGECMKIIEEMEPKIADDAYIRAIKVLQEKGWREAFLHMSDKLRRVWISSI